MGAAYYNELDPYAAQWLRNLIGAGLIDETKFGRWMMHTVDEGMTGRAQHPHLFRPHIEVNPSARPISVMPWLMSNVEHSGFPTRFAGMGSRGVGSIEPQHRVVWQALRFCSGPIEFNPFGITLMELSDTLSVAGPPASVGAKPLIPLVGTDREDLATHPTGVFGHGDVCLPLPESQGLTPTGLATARAVFATEIGASKVCATSHTGVYLSHVGSISSFRGGVKR